MTDNSKKTWLITGGAGFIGSAIAAELVRMKQKVVILDNFSSSDPSSLKKIKKSVKIIRGDIRNLHDTIKAVKGVDYVLHHAALISVPQSVEQPKLTKEINLEGTFNVLFAAYSAGVKRVVLASSSAVYGNGKDMPYKETAKTDPHSPYAETKLQGEKLCRAFYDFYGMECVILRYFNVFGPGQNPNSEYSAVIAKFIDNAKSGKEFTIFGDGKQSRDFVFVTDVVQANILAAQKAKAGEIYNVSGAKSYTLLQLAKTIGNISGKKINLKLEAERKGDVKESSADISKIKAIGFKPQISLEQGLKIMLEKK